MALASTSALVVGGAPRVNLLPRAVTERRERSILLRKWGWGLVAALAVVVLAAAGTYVLQFAAQQRLAAENTRTNDLLVQVAALQPVSQKLQLQTELGDFRVQAMGTDLEWTGLLDSIRTALPADVGIIEYTLAPGGLPQGDAPDAGVGAQGTVNFTSATPTDIVGLIRSVRTLPGIIDADGWASTLSGSEYRYELRVTFDQTVYTGTFAAEATE
ncbi:hypothetical protein [uncultured Microbacterium sp.]|uniref:hypothetical protein n=1 Tax=uncultured Microbacterium sp. TaxID=191216 RepID=UPI0026278BC0|nr:hypothetical protein [uncultured Microbacterium sp.]